MIRCCKVIYLLLYPSSGYLTICNVLAIVDAAHAMIKSDKQLNLEKKKR